MVDRPGLLGQLERLEAEKPGKLEAAIERLVRLGAYGREPAVELLGASRAGEGLQRVEAEAPLVRVERR